MLLYFRVKEELSRSSLHCLTADGGVLTVIGSL